MSNFSINTNFQMGNFNNSINEFNKVFNDSIKDTNKAFSNSDNNFAEVFDSVASQKPIEAGIQYQQIGADTINSQKVENLSPVAQMASDIGKGLKNSVQELNHTQKDAETKAEIFAAGGDISVHDVMIAARKSSVAMQMAIQLRNQIVTAYNELRNITV